MNEPAMASIWRFGEWELDERTRELRTGSTLVEIEPKSFDLLLALLQRAGEIVTINEFQELVWPGRIVAESAVTNIVSKLRRLLGDDDQLIIRTVPKAGYRLLVPVQRVQARRTAAAPTTLTAGDPVPGREQWQLVEAMSGGAHRDVWLAEHYKTREKRVFKFCFDSERLSALKREVTLSRLLQDVLGSRDGYVRILEWNFDGAPFFIELAYAGNNLRHWLEARGGVTAIPIDDRIELVATVADELAAAHSIGVLHKDLKPENVLIEEREGTRKIRLVDFGAGRLLDSGVLSELGITRLGFTQSASLDESTTGTLIYLAPELFAGGTASVQSDIYSLGVMLYQLITGKFGAPLAPGWEADVGDELLREDIVEATHGSRDRRLPSAQLLAQRLRALGARRAELQRQRTEEARAAQAFEAIKRARARRPWLIVAALAIFAGVAVGTYLFIQERQQARTTEALNSFLTEDILQAASPQNGGSKDTTILTAIQQAAPRVEQRFSGQPQIEAVVDESLGTVFEDLSEYPESLKTFQREVALEASLYGPDDVRTLLGQIHVADVLLLTRDWEAGVNLFRQSYSKLVEKLDADDPRLLYARYVQIRLDRIETKISENIGEARQLLDDCNRVMPDSSLTAQVEELYLLTLVGAGPDRAKDLEAESRKQLDLAVRRFGVDHFRTLMIRLNLGHALTIEGRYAEAEAELEATMAGLIKLVGPNHIEVFKCNFELSRLYAAQGQWEKAAAGSLASWRWAQRTFGGTARLTIQQQALYAMALDHLDRTAEALPLAEAAYNQAWQGLSPTDVVYVDTCNVLGFIYVHLGRLEDARRMADEYRKIITSKPFVGQPIFRDWVATSHFLDAQVALGAGDRSTARLEAEVARNMSARDRDSNNTMDIDSFLKTLDATVPSSAAAH